MQNITATQIETVIEMNALLKKIVAIDKDIKQMDVLLEQHKKRLAELLPSDGIVLDGIKASWAEKVTKTLQKALVEDKLGVKITDDCYKVTPSKYVVVTQLN